MEKPHLLRKHTLYTHTHTQLDRGIRSGQVEDPGHKLGCTRHDARPPPRCGAPVYPARPPPMSLSIPETTHLLARCKLTSFGFEHRRKGRASAERWGWGIAWVACCATGVSNRASAHLSSDKPDRQDDSPHSHFHHG